MGVVVDGPWSLSSPRADGFVVFFETLFSLSHRQYPRVVSAIHQATLFAAAHYPISIGHRHCGRVKPRDILPPADLVHRRRRLDKIDRIDGSDTVVTKSWMASTQAIWHPMCLASRASPAGRRDADATLADSGPPNPDSRRPPGNHRPDPGLLLLPCSPAELRPSIQ